jgi:alginate O-acetyltransferase complex protein AlgJ
MSRRLEEASEEGRHHRPDIGEVEKAMRSTWLLSVSILFGLYGLTSSGVAAPATNAGAEVAVVAGKDGRLFLADEIRHYRVGRFWGMPGGKKNADPLPAIVSFARQAQKAGAKVVLVPVPGKAALYPESLGETLPADVHAEFYAELRKAGVIVVDMLPVFVEMRKKGIETHCRSDSHWTPAAMQAAAAAVADVIGRKAGVAYMEETLTINGDLPAMLKLPPMDEKLPLRRPMTDGKVPVTDDEKSPVVLMGDSHAFVYSWPIAGGIQAQGAGLGECLAAELGSSVDGIATAGSGANASRMTLARRKDNLAGKKWLVWCFAIREFTQAQQGWMELPVFRD